MQNPGHAWYHWAIAAAVVVAAVAAVVVTAGGAAPALMAAAAIVNGSVAAAATVPTVALVAAGVAIGGGMALATSAMDAEQSSTSLEDFWDYGENAMYNTIGGCAIGALDGYMMSLGNRSSSPAPEANDSGNTAQTISSEGAGNTTKGIDSITGQIPKDKPVVVIGESMGRVNPVAEQLKQTGFDVKTYNPKNFRSSPGNLNSLDVEANRSWIRYWTKDKGATVIDIGIDSSRTARSPFYGVENRSVYQNWKYPNVIKYNP